MCLSSGAATRKPERILPSVLIRTRKKVLNLSFSPAFYISILRYTHVFFPGVLIPLRIKIQNLPVLPLLRRYLSIVSTMCTYTRVRK